MTTTLPALAVSLLLATLTTPKGDPKGTLVIDGGGQPSMLVRKRALEIAGGPAARVVILPQASNLTIAGPKSEQRWREAGAENVAILSLADPMAAVEVIRRADLIWIGGGDQERLMQRLKGTGVAQAIKEKFRDGAVVGGTSAGAAVMSDVMIARGVDEYPKPLCDYPLMGRGLGLWPGVIVDQHFLKKRRADRLKRAMAEFPGLIGIGIDESTAAFVHGQTIEVVGDSQVVVIDPRKRGPNKPPVLVVSTSAPRPKEGGGDAQPGLEESAWKTSTLNPGMTFDLDRGMISDPIAETR